MDSSYDISSYDDKRAKLLDKINNLIVDNELGEINTCMFCQRKDVN